MTLLSSCEDNFLNHNYLHIKLKNEKSLKSKKMSLIHMLQCIYSMVSAKSEYGGSFC